VLRRVTRASCIESSDQPLSACRVWLVVRIMIKTVSQWIYYCGFAVVLLCTFQRLAAVRHIVATTNGT